jgi:hypothetical protein
MHMRNLQPSGNGFKLLLDICSLRCLLCQVLFPWVPVSLTDNRPTLCSFAEDIVAPIFSFSTELFDNFPNP